MRMSKQNNRCRAQLASFARTVFRLQNIVMQIIRLLNHALVAIFAPGEAHLLRALGLVQRASTAQHKHLLSLVKLVITALGPAILLLYHAILGRLAQRQARATVSYARLVHSVLALEELNLIVAKQDGSVTKRACPSHQNAVQVALSVKKEPPPMTLIAFSEYHQGLVRLVRFVLRVLPITLHLAGYRALRWARWLLSHVRKDTFAPPIRLLLLVVANAILDTIVLKIHHILFKLHQAHLLVMTEGRLWEVFVSRAHSHQGQVKSAVLPVQQEAPVSAMARMCLVFADVGPTDQKQTQYSVSLVQNELILLLAA
mmetsp:Transcript_9724/g.21927  ORF Transcript_9724/g.21927 Transcript_9724/m.21927 type:complete len:314 (+) Transcript_9724:988-1929(+)